MSATATIPRTSQRPESNAPMPDARGAHPVTRESHEAAVLRIAKMMRHRYPEEITLADMAKEAMFSPYYTNRMFRLLTGIQPRRFLAAVRFDAAKRLLLGSARSVTDICFEVGYSSLGSFTSRFHEGVGMSPREFRRFRETMAERAVPPEAVGACSSDSGSNMIRGSIESGDGEEDREAVAFVGLFPTPLPEGAPLACALSPAPGWFSFRTSKAGTAYLLSVAIPRHATRSEGLRLEDPQVRVAAEPVTLAGQGQTVEVDLALRPLRATDPPVVSALPYLLERALQRAGGLPGSRRSLATV